ncbi:MAG: SRPBCC domain-containing protein [Deltaproteobacteria bacterium]|nr:SRPBCC domain-containing protein [Deltaproteobacteria bacterium]
MKEIHTEIEIAAGKDEVWSVLTSFAAYPDWNPFLRTVAAALRPDAPVAMSVAVGARTLDLDAAIMRVAPGRELRWAGPISRLQGVVFRGEHYFVMEEIAPRRVRFVHGERFAGLAIPLLGGWLDRTLTPAYTAMNVALKRRVEAAAAR